MEQVNFFSRTLINSLLKDFNGLSVTTTNIPNDTIIYEDEKVIITMTITESDSNIPYFSHKYSLKQHHAVSIYDISLLKDSLYTASLLVDRTKLLFEFQTEFFNEISETLHH